MSHGWDLPYKQGQRREEYTCYVSITWLTTYLELVKVSEDRSYVTYHVTEEGRGTPLEETIRTLYRLLIDEKTVDTCLAFTEKKQGSGMQGVSIEATSDVKVSDPRLFSQYLATGLPRLLSIPKVIQTQLAGCFDKKIALVARPCEIEALVELSKRNQVAFENLFIIGLECPGITSFSELAGAIKKRGADQSKIDYCEIVPEEVAVKVNAGKDIVLKIGQDVKMRECCSRCRNREPAICDVNLSAWRRDLSSIPNILIRPESDKGKDLIRLAKSRGLLTAAKASDIAEKEQKDAVLRNIEKNAAERFAKESTELMGLEGKQRFDKLKELLNPCTKCGLCVRACPVCWCKDCILLKKIKTIDPLLLHTTRLVHMGDTCVNCGKCDENCPKGIQISRIYFGLATELSRQSGYRPGLALDQPPRRSGKIMLSKA
jgi:formate dehydrogenase subunit beta